MSCLCCDRYRQRTLRKRMLDGASLLSQHSLDSRLDSGVVHPVSLHSTTMTSVEEDCGRTVTLQLPIHHCCGTLLFRSCIYAGRARGYTASSHVDTVLTHSDPLKRVLVS